MTETELTVALMNHYGIQAGNGQRYAVAAQVRSHAGFDARRTADFVAMDLWPSSGLALHGHEVKVSRSDWLRELKDPAKAEEFTPYMNHWWVTVPDEQMVRDGELPDGWGLLAMRGEKLAVIRKAPHREALPMPPTRLAALLRAVAGTAGNYARLDAERKRAAGLARNYAADDEMEKLRRQVVAAKKDARAWQAAFAAAGHLPCAHCGRPVKPAKVRTMFLYDWRHLRVADEAACAEIRAAKGQRVDIAPAEDAEVPEVRS
jgi:hypothetical protein